MRLSHYKKYELVVEGALSNLRQLEAEISCLVLSAETVSDLPTFFDDLYKDQATANILKAKPPKYYDCVGAL